MGINVANLRTKEMMLDGIVKMNDCGHRHTGSPGHKAFIKQIKEDIAKLGIETISTEYTFDRWEALDASISIEGETIAVSSPFPYSGSTSAEGITGELVEIANNIFGYCQAKDKIGVVHIKNLSKISSKVAFDKRNSLPAELEVEPSYRGPVSTCFVKTILYSLLKKSGIKGLICVWEDMSDAMVDKQYLNFILGELDVPVVWVNESEGKKVFSAAEAHKTATLILTAEHEKDCITESFYSLIKGTELDNKEIIMINTHTDGGNCVEENGAIAMVALMEYFIKNPPKHSLLFVFVTGHFRLEEFKKGIDQATSKWMLGNLDLWSGSNGGYTAYAGLAVEHLGCTEWKDKDGIYQKTNDVDVELVYTGNKKIDDIYYKAISDRKLIRTMTLRGHNKLHFGEGQPLFNRGIPEIALVTAPDYLCAEADNHQMDKFNLDLFFEQTCTFANCIELLDNESSASLGTTDGYSYGLGRLK